MELEYEKSTDELWDEAQTSEQDVDDIPDDDSDLLGDEPAQVETSTESESPALSQFDINAHLPQIADYLRKEVLPQYQSETIEETMRRTRQSQKARDEQIKTQLAPLVAYLQQQEQQGMSTREDSQKAIQQAYQNANRELTEREHAQIEWETKQRWLAGQQKQQQPSPVPQEYQRQVASTEGAMNQILAQSGLTEADPEWAQVPLNITNPDPKEALDYFQVKVATATQAKQQRLRASATPKPLIDMGDGGGAGSGNPIASIEDTDELWRLATGG